MCKQVYFLLCLFGLFAFSLRGQNTSYQLFENFELSTEASAINCFLQDAQGVVWMGSNKGLFSYDGYNSQAHFTFNEPGNSRINCGVLVGTSHLYLGADNGILIYNYRTDRYEQAPVRFPTDVRTLALQNETLWIGTLNGLYTFHLQTKVLRSFDRKRYATLPHAAIYSIIRTANDQIYIGTYNGFCRYDAAQDRFEPIPLPINLHKNNQFINSLLEDKGRGCIWIGAEGNLFKYTPTSGKTQQIKAFYNNSVKSLALDKKHRLLIGTDNGLYVYSESEAPLHVFHDSRNQESLSNNIIWNIFTDQEGNIWLGTDHGISLSRYNNAFQYIPISQITATGEGNQFYSLFKDSENTYWFGGTNGLIQFINPTGTEHHTLWHKIGDPHHPLPHNRIRHIYEDRDKQLWIATDGSINRYDRARKRFLPYNIVDSTHSYNANWAYHLFEDNQGQLWIATCLGGIFIVDKQQLMQSDAHTHVAKHHYSLRNGLSGMFINQLVPDQQGHVWVLLYNHGIDKINTHTQQVSKLSFTDNQRPNYILCDQEGFIWAGFGGGVMRIHPQNNQFETVHFDAFSNYEVFSMIEVEKQILISTSGGFWVVHKETMEVRRLNLTKKRFTSMYYDAIEQLIYLGGRDGFALTTPDALRVNTLNRPIIITGLYINNEPLRNIAQSVRYTNHIELAYNENNLTLSLSDLPYSLEEKSKFVYQLTGIDRDWVLLDPNTNSISYNNLHYGDYQLTISKLDSTGHPSDNRYLLSIRIHPPWYYTWWAKTFYLLLFITLGVWVANYFRVKHRLKMERIEKEKILKQSRQKMEFFTNLSHDLNIPLSKIIAPLSKLLPEIKNTQEKRALEEVQQNALKMNALIHQVLDFSRLDNDSNALLILSQVELVTFARHLLAVYEQAGKEKGLTFCFQSNRKHLYLDIDAIKWESILGNLLSNAVKYTPAGGRITLTLSCDTSSQSVIVSLTDTGIGIPPQDILYVCQRFFQSSRTTGRREGTGIGLYLVKTYTELHGGTLAIASVENQGTTVSLTFPLPTGGELSQSSELSYEDELSHSSQLPVDSEQTELAIAPAAKFTPVLRPIEAVSYDETFLSNVTRLIEDHLSNSDFNVNALCERSGMNNKQTCRKLKQLTGMTPVEYIKTIRMKKAAMLLEQRKFSVAEVMYMVGFSNHSYFSKCFQAEFGKTPRQFMEERI